MKKNIHIFTFIILGVMFLLFFSMSGCLSNVTDYFLSFYPNWLLENAEERNIIARKYILIPFLIIIFLIDFIIIVKKKLRARKNVKDEEN